MDKLEVRVTRCFQVAFPDLDEGSICQATAESTPGWDSVATVTLISLLEEEFGITINLEHVEHLDSFARFAAYVRANNREAVTNGDK